MSWGWGGDYGDYVSATEKRRRAEVAARKLEKKGVKLSPVRIDGRTIANTFWGKAWCQNLESYSDFESRLPRGRTYVRNGSVLDLRIERGVVMSKVAGSELYDIKIKINPLAKADWSRLKRECAGKVGSLLDLLRGKLSGPVMEVITGKDGGLFPKPREIHLDCSCADYADMCKHVAATLYGVGARLDQSPELLFTLRGVDHLELIAETTQSLTAGLAAGGTGDGGSDTLDEGSLSEVFGIEMEPAGVEVPRAPAVVMKYVQKPKPKKRAAAGKKATRPATRKLVVKPGKAAATPKDVVKRQIAKRPAKVAAKINKKNSSAMSAKADSRKKKL